MAYSLPKLLKGERESLCFVKQSRRNPLIAARVVPLPHRERILMWSYAQAPGSDEFPLSAEPIAGFYEYLSGRKYRYELVICQGTKCKVRSQWMHMSEAGSLHVTRVKIKTSDISVSLPKRISFIRSLALWFRLC